MASSATSESKWSIQSQTSYSELAMKLQQQTQQHLEQQQSPKKPLTETLAAGTKLTLQQQQLLLPTEPNPQIAA